MVQTYRVRRFQSQLASLDRTYVELCAAVAALGFITGWTNADLHGFFAPWGRVAFQYGIADVYNRTGIDNGPLAALLYAIPAGIETVFRVTDVHLDPFLFKIVPLTGLFAAPYVMRSLLRTVGIVDTRFWLLSLMTVGNPILIYITAIWGQNDVLLFDLAGLSAVQFIRRNSFGGAVLYCADMLIKPTPFVALPAIAALAIMARQPLRTAQGIVVVLLACLPVVYPHGGFFRGYTWLLNVFVNASREYPIADIGAGTLSAVLSGQGLPPDNYHVLCMTLVGIAAAMVVYGMLRSGVLSHPNAIWYLAVSSTAVYWLAPRMHERYLTIGAMFAIAWAFAARKNIATLAACMLSAALFVQVVSNGIIDLGWGDTVFTAIRHGVPESIYFIFYCAANGLGLLTLLSSRATAPAQTLSSG